MKYLSIYFLLIFSLLPILGCQKSNKSLTQVDNKSYINDFELLQENPNNQTRIKITSPKAIIDPLNNDIEIFESSIEILNKNGQDFNVKSGNSTELLPLEIDFSDSGEITLIDTASYTSNGGLTPLLIDSIKALIIKKSIPP